MPESFGARLRQRREEQGIALAAIAARTKIKQSLLEALERDDVSHWPGGIFRRAYMRAYAEAIGIDPEPVVREFLERFPDPTETLIPEPGLPDASRTGGPPTRLRTLVGAAIESLARFRPAHVSDDSLAPIVDRRAVVAAAPDREPVTDDGVVATIGHAKPEPAPERVVESEPAPHAERKPTPPAEPTRDLAALARLCTALGRVARADEIPQLLEEAASLLDAGGIILWMPDAIGRELKPALAYGYSERVLAYLPSVWTDADNATASAFREQRTCIIAGTDQQNGALVVPLLTPDGCSGVLALELCNAGERSESVQAFATVLAAMLAQLTYQPTEARQQPQPEARRQPETMSVVRFRVSADAVSA